MSTIFIPDHRHRRHPAYTRALAVIRLLRLKEALMAELEDAQDAGYAEHHLWEVLGILQGAPLRDPRPRPPPAECPPF